MLFLSEINPESVIRRDPSDLQVDMHRKLMEDPLLLIRKQEEETKRQITNNPVKMKQLQQLVGSGRVILLKEKIQHIFITITGNFSVHLLFLSELGGVRKNLRRFAFKLKRGGIICHNRIHIPLLF